MASLSTSLTSETRFAKRPLAKRRTCDGEVACERKEVPSCISNSSAIGIARIGDSPDEFCISPETPGALPIACDKNGNPLLSPDGKSVETVKTFKDKEGRIKRQAARFQIYVYDDASHEGRPLEVGAPVEGGGNHGTLVDIQWRVYLANKKSVWYQFNQLQGEHGYLAGYPLRNPGITDPDAARLIIDPGPKSSTKNIAVRPSIAAPTASMRPPSRRRGCSRCVDQHAGQTVTDDAGRLLVLGAHGRSGSSSPASASPASILCQQRWLV